MKIAFCLFFFFIMGNEQITAQEVIKVKYSDSLWNPVDKSAAFYISTYTQAGTTIKQVTTWAASGKLYTISHSPDTATRIFVGNYKKYYASGQLEDSSSYNDAGKMMRSYYFYPDGKLWVDYAIDPRTGKENTKGFDTDGKPLKDFIYFREAEFRGGLEKWKSHLSGNVKAKVPIKKGAPKGSYNVVVRFVIDGDGTVVNIEPETNMGYGMEEELIRVIRKSPKWIPAVFVNKPVRAYRRQPLTFVVQE